MDYKLIRTDKDEYCFIETDSDNRKFIFCNDLTGTIRLLRMIYKFQWDDIRGAIYHLKKPINNISILGIDGMYITSYLATQQEIINEYEDSNVSDLLKTFNFG